jgi:hypothetical protein
VDVKTTWERGNVVAALALGAITTNRNANKEIDQGHLCMQCVLHLTISFV